MKAIFKSRACLGGLELIEYEEPTLTNGMTLVRILKTAICGTDIHIYNWDNWAQKTIRPPQIIGHEFVGEVIKTKSERIKIGDIVSGEGHIVCGICRHCITGESHLCRKTIGIGVDAHGVFSEIIAFPTRNLWVCPKDISLDLLAIMDPLGNAYHTATAFNVLGEDVLITGAGPIGLMCVSILLRAGARYIVVTDINKKRLDMAKNLGATRAVLPRELPEVIKELNMKEGFDVGLEVSGSSEGFRSTIKYMANGGGVALLGIPPGDATADWNKVVFSSLTIKGIYGRRIFDTWYKITALLQSGLEIASIVTHSYDYTEYEAAFLAMKSGETGKVILSWSV